MNGFVFPKDFYWGTATASYQIEGAHDVDGKGLSTWDTFSRIPGKIFNNDTGDIACNSYYLYKEDIQLMKSMGLNAYRFSIAWPRILPEGEGKINQKGLDYYEKVIDTLLENEIEPFITLFHWDLPQALEDKYGGWRNKDVSRLFAEYAGLVVKKFSDRVKYWTTINEISCFTVYAHKSEKHAPGKKEPDQIVNQTVHNALLGHGMALNSIRANAKSDLKIGLVENTPSVWPVYEHPKHIEAAKKAWIDRNQQIVFPLFTGKYSDEFIEEIGKDMPVYSDDEMKIINSPVDYIGYNIYSGEAVQYAGNERGYEIVNFSRDYGKTEMDWPITPKALYFVLKCSSELFGNIPTFITENGMAAFDLENEKGEVLDLSRVEYLRTHLEMAGRAVNEGVNLKGYFVWSFMDNFEWAHGYSKRFGIVRVNYSSMARTLKLSGRYYSDVIKTGKVL